MLHRYDLVVPIETRIIKKAAVLLAGLSWRQAFREGNKEIAASLTTDFLRQNGFDLPVNSESEVEELRKLLVGTIEKFENENIYEDVEEYLRRKIVRLRP